MRAQFGRRQFLTQSISTAAALGLHSGKWALPACAAEQIREVPDLGVVPNRTPLAPNAFCFLPLRSIHPRGWLLRQLRIQADGLSGHLGEVWPDVGPNSGWLGGSGESWERGPYYLDGLVPLAWLLGDDRLKGIALRFLNWTLDNQDSNGMFGPKTNDDWWPRIVMLKVLTQYQEFTGDARVIPFMHRYFSHQLGELTARPLRDWAKFRWQDEVISVIWLYNRTGEKSLLQLAQMLTKQGHDWVAQFADFKFTGQFTASTLKLDQGTGLGELALSTHGVNNGQAVKTGAVSSLLSHSETDRDAVSKMIAELDRYDGLPNGMFSCDEHLAGLDPSQGSELCTVVEYMFSLEQALAITGNAELGDRLEQLAFNALPGAFTDDMWAHQYNQQPNQVDCSLHRKPWTTDGPESNIFGLAPNFGCCTANFNQGWPKLCSSLFLVSASADKMVPNGLVAAVYAPCEVDAVLNGVKVLVREETEYPFKGSVHFSLEPEAPVSFCFQLRIPKWTEGASIYVNEIRQESPMPDSFARVERTWRHGDRVEIRFPMNPRIVRGFRDSVSVARGPLVFSYGIGEDWVKLRDRCATTDWQVYPTTPWNYALDLDLTQPSNGITVSETEVRENPFSALRTPVKLQVKARKISAWVAEDGSPDEIPQSPITTETPIETITLIPYAAAKLRITAFPHCSTKNIGSIAPSAFDLPSAESTG